MQAGQTYQCLHHTLDTHRHTHTTCSQVLVSMLHSMGLPYRFKSGTLGFQVVDKVTNEIGVVDGCFQKLITNLTAARD